MSSFAFGKDKRDDILKRVTQERINALLRKLPLDSSLDFRAAANAAVDKSHGPISVKILKRISSSPEFKNEILDPLLDSLHVTEIATACLNEDPFMEQRIGDGTVEIELLFRVVVRKIFKMISEDVRFAVVVNDAVDEEKRWSDILRKDSGALAERLRSLWEKIWSKDHPIARVAATAAVAVTTVRVGLLITASATGALQLPVAPVVSSMAPISIPLKIVPSSTSIDINVPETHHDSASRDSIIRLTNALLGIGHALNEQASSFKQQQFQATEKTGPERRVALYFPELTTAITKETESISKLIDDRQKLADEVKSSEEVVRALGVQLSSQTAAQDKVEAALELQKEVQTISLQDEGKATLQLQFFDRKTGYRTCMLGILAHVSDTVQLDIDSSSCNKAGKVEQVDLIKGRAITVTGIPVLVEVTDVIHKAFRKKSVSLRVVS